MAAAAVSLRPGVPVRRRGTGEPQLGRPVGAGPVVLVPTKGNADRSRPEGETPTGGARKGNDDLVPQPER